MAIDKYYDYLQNRLIQTSQTGGQQYSDTSPFSSPWTDDKRVFWPHHQLSHDLIPVVYHDYELLASIVNKKGDQQMMVQMPLKNLTLHQLQQIKVRAWHCSYYL